MADDLHLHILDHMNDCIRGVLGAVADELNDRARDMRESKDGKPSNAEQALREAACDIESLGDQFK